MKRLSLWTVAVLAVATCLLVHESAQAQGRGGASISIGGVRIGVGSGGYGGYGGYGGGYGSSYGRYGGYGSGYGGGPGYGYGSGSYGRNYGIVISPGYRSSSYPGSYGPGYYNGGYPSSGYPSGGYYYDRGYAAAPEPLGTMQVEVHVPSPDARVTFNGVTSSSRSDTRYFETNYLQPGRNYSFDVQASWMEGGREMKQTKTVTGQAGQTVQVYFVREGAPVRPVSGDADRLPLPLEKVRPIDKSRDSGTGRPTSPDIGRPIDDAVRDVIRDLNRDLIREPGRDPVRDPLEKLLTPPDRR